MCCANKEFELFLSLDLQYGVKHFDSLQFGFFLTNTGAHFTCINTDLLWINYFEFRIKFFLVESFHNFQFQRCVIKIKFDIFPKLSCRHGIRDWQGHTPRDVRKWIRYILYCYTCNKENPISNNSPCTWRGPGDVFISCKLL